jgi:clan AA aspartic protease (TIGR02281 family)
MKHLLFILILLPGASWATTYKCVDEGRVTYSTKPCGDNAQVMPYTDNQAISQGKLVLSLDMNHSYRTPGTVNGKPVSFVVDTGASGTAISQRVAQAAGVNGCIGEVISYTANGVVKICKVTVPEITFGEFRVKNLVVVIMPNMPVDALLGMDVLGRLKIHQENGVLYISGN